MRRIFAEDSTVNIKFHDNQKDLPNLHSMYKRYGYPVPIAIVLQRLIDRQFQINNYKIRGDK